MQNKLNKQYTDTDNMSTMRINGSEDSQVLFIKRFKLESIYKDVFDSLNNKNLKLFFGKETLNIISIDKFGSSLNKIWTKLNSKVSENLKFFNNLHKEKNYWKKIYGIIDFFLAESR